MAVYAGFPARHVAVYRLRGGRPAIIALLTPRNSSHALSEVKTKRGWVAVNSTTRWIGLDAEGQPQSIAQLAALEESARSWDKSVGAPQGILRGRLTHVIGLYSRHGLFYPPYLPFPEYNLRQQAVNFRERAIAVNAR